VKLTNAAGAVTVTRQYDAWGEPEAGASEPGYAYTGREWDPGTGFYFYRARYYDPKGGRFISENPTGFERGDVNLDAYVGNNPPNATDPTGLYCVYQQSTGSLVCYPASRAEQPVCSNACESPGRQQDGMPPYYEEQGYWGGGAGRNNPDMQHEVDTGPTPRGPWPYRGKPYWDPVSKANAMRLVPLPGNECRRPRDCSTFRMARWRSRCFHPLHRPAAQSHEDPKWRGGLCRTVTAPPGCSLY
jgi:RHS repeat-associated protein